MSNRGSPSPRRDGGYVYDAARAAPYLVHGDKASDDYDKDRYGEEGGYPPEYADTWNTSQFSDYNNYQSSDWNDRSSTDSWQRRRRNDLRRSSDVGSTIGTHREVCHHSEECDCFTALEENFERQISTLRSALESATSQLDRLSDSVSGRAMQATIEAGSEHMRRRQHLLASHADDSSDSLAGSTLSAEEEKRRQKQEKELLAAAAIAGTLAPEQSSSHISKLAAGGTDDDDDDDASDMEEPVTTCNRRFLIHPNNTFRRNWDMWIACCLLYNAIILPWRVCFNVNSSGPAFVVETIIDGFVGLDIFFNFRTAYFLMGVLITNARQVAVHYLKTWFTIDLIATLPYDLIIESFILTDDGATDDDGERASVFRLPRLVRLARLVRLVRLLRLLRLTRIWQKFQDRLEVHFGPVKIVKVTFILLMFIHWFGCFWFLLASLKDFTGTWAEAYGVGHESLWTQYLTSVYFAFQSVTTLGYGDIVPQNDDERLFFFCVMLLGLSVYGWLLGSLASLIHASDQRDAKFRDRMMRLNAYLEHHKVPNELRVRVRAYVRHSHENQGAQLVEDEIYANMSNSLRSEMSSHLNASILRQLPFLSEAPPEALKAILLKLRVRSAQAGENIVTAGRFGDQMYILVRGSAQVVSADDSKIYATLEEGSYFGEIALMHSTRRSATVRAVTHCDLRSLSKGDFDDVLNRFPELVRPFEKEAQKRLQQISEVERKAVSISRDHSVATALSGLTSAK